MSLGRHSIDGHPASSGQLSVITILGRNRHVRTDRVLRVRAANIPSRPARDTVRIRQAMPGPARA